MKLESLRHRTRIATEGLLTGFGLVALFTAVEMLPAPKEPQKLDYQSPATVLGFEESFSHYAPSHLAPVTVKATVTVEQCEPVPPNRCQQFTLYSTDELIAGLNQGDQVIPAEVVAE